MIKKERDELQASLINLTQAMRVLEAETKRHEIENARVCCLVFTFFSKTLTHMCKPKGIDFFKKNMQTTKNHLIATEHVQD